MLDHCGRCASDTPTPLYHLHSHPPSLCVFGSPPRDRTRIQGSIVTIFYGSPHIVHYTHLHFLSLYQSYVNTFVPYMVLCVYSPLSTLSLVYLEHPTLLAYTLQHNGRQRLIVQYLFIATPTH